MLRACGDAGRVLRSPNEDADEGWPVELPDQCWQSKEVLDYLRASEEYTLAQIPDCVPVRGSREGAESLQ